MRWRNRFERLGFGWGWKDKGMMGANIASLKRIRGNGGIETTYDLRVYRRALAILGKFAHDNECDVEGFPMYLGPIGDIRRLAEDVGSKL